jgi:hypothetical protein
MPLLMAAMVMLGVAKAGLARCPDRAGRADDGHGRRLLRFTQDCPEGNYTTCALPA